MSPLYAYRCDSCGHETSTTERGNRAPCANCGCNAKRSFGFRVAASFQPHFNHTVGAPVNNEREFADKLKRAAEVQTEKTGLYHDYVPVPAGDREAFGITDEHLAALEPTKKRAHDQAVA